MNFRVLITCCLLAANLLAFRIDQNYDGTSYKSSEEFEIDFSNIKNRHKDDVHEIDGAGVAIIYTTTNNNKKYVLASKKRNPDSEVEEYEIGIGGGFRLLKDFSTLGALNEFLNYKSQGLLGNLQESDLDQKATSLFGKGKDWHMNRVTFVARKNINNLEELIILVNQINNKNSLLPESDARSKIKFGIFLLEDVFKSADLTFDKHDKGPDRLSQVKDLDAIDLLSNEKIPNFVIYDDRAMAVIERLHAK